MIKKRFFLFLLLSALIWSCCPSKTIMLSKDKAQWIPYKKGDTIYFENENNSDTLIVIERKSEVELRTSECSEFYQEHIRTTIESTHFQLTIDLNEKDIYFSIQFDSLQIMRSAFHFFEGDYSEETVLKSSFTLGEKKYTNVIVATLNEFILYYAKGIGIIGYKKNNQLYAFLN